MKQIRNFWQLSNPDKLMVIKTTVILAFLTLAIKLIPWLTVQNLLLKHAKKHSRINSVRRPSEQHIGWIVSIVGRYIPDATCLPQGLTAQYLLVQNGYPADLQIGVAKQANGQLAAHAWVLSENNIIVGGVPDLENYVKLSTTDR